MCVYMQQLLRRLITGGPGYTVSSVGQPNEPQDVGGLGWIRFVFKRLLMFAPVQVSCAVLPCLVKLLRDGFVLFEGNYGAL